MRGRFLTGWLLSALATMLLGGCQAPRSGLAPGGDMKKMVICLPPSANAGESLAASELALHLRKVFGIEAPILHVAVVTTFDDDVFPAYIGFVPEGVVKPAPGHGGFLVNDEAAYFYGTDLLADRGVTSTIAQALGPESRPATAFALYQYLEEVCGVRWPAPKVITYPPIDPSGIPQAAGTFTPDSKRGKWMETAVAQKDAVLLDDTIQAALELDEVRAGVRQLHLNLWLKRLRLALLQGQEREDVLFDAWCPGAAEELYGNMEPLGKAPTGNLLLRGRLLDWGLAGLMQYVLAQGLESGFEQGFDSLVSDYFNRFGPAYDDVRAYYTAWRDAYVEAAASAPMLHFDYLPSVMSIARLTELSEHLDRATGRSGLTESAKNQLDRLLMGHEQTMLMLEAHDALTRATPDTLAAALEQVRHLVAVRSHLKSSVLVDFVQLAQSEIRACDLVGLRFLQLTVGLTPSAKVETWRGMHEFSPATDVNGGLEVDVEALQEWPPLDLAGQPGPSAERYAWCTALVVNPVPDHLRSKAFVVIWGLAEGARVFFNGVEMTASEERPVGSAKFAIPQFAFSDQPRQALLLQMPEVARVFPCRGAWFMTVSE